MFLVPDDKPTQKLSKLVNSNSQKKSEFSSKKPHLAILMHNSENFRGIESTLSPINGTRDKSPLFKSDDLSNLFIVEES